MLSFPLFKNSELPAPASVSAYASASGVFIFALPFPAVGEREMNLISGESKVLDICLGHRIVAMISLFGPFHRVTLVVFDPRVNPRGVSTVYWTEFSGEMERKEEFKTVQKVVRSSSSMASKSD